MDPSWPLARAARGQHENCRRSLNWTHPLTAVPPNLANKIQTQGTHRSTQTDGQTHRRTQAGGDWPLWISPSGEEFAAPLGSPAQRQVRAGTALRPRPPAQRQGQPGGRASRGSAGPIGDLSRGHSGRQEGGEGGRHGTHRQFLPRIMADTETAVGHSREPDASEGAGPGPLAHLQRQGEAARSPSGTGRQPQARPDELELSNGSRPARVGEAALASQATRVAPRGCPRGWTRLAAGASWRVGASSPIRMRPTVKQMLALLAIHLIVQQHYNHLALTNFCLFASAFGQPAASRRHPRWPQPAGAPPQAPLAPPSRPVGARWPPLATGAALASFRPRTVRGLSWAVLGGQHANSARPTDERPALINGPGGPQIGARRSKRNAGHASRGASDAQEPGAGSGGAAGGAAGQAADSLARVAGGPGEQQERALAALQRERLQQQQQQQQQQQLQQQQQHAKTVSLAEQAFQSRLLVLRQKYMTNRAINDRAYYILLAIYALFITFGTVTNGLICLVVSRRVPLWTVAPHSLSLVGGLALSLFSPPLPRPKAALLPSSASSPLPLQRQPVRVRSIHQNQSSFPPREPLLAAPNWGRPQTACRD